MKPLSFASALCFVASSLAFPDSRDLLAETLTPPDVQTEKLVNSILKFMKRVEAQEISPEDEASVQSICAFDRTDDAMQKKCKRTFAKSTKAVLKIIKSTMRRDGNSTDADMQEMAHELAQSLRDVPLETVHVILYNENAAMTRKMVDSLKEAVTTSNNIKSGRSLLLELKKQNLLLFCKLPMRVPPDSSEQSEFRGAYDSCSGSQWNTFGDIWTSGWLKNVYEFLQNEENALDAVKNLAILTAAVKDPSSYSGFDDVISSISKNDFWAAGGTIVKETARCYRNEALSSGNREKFDEYIKELLGYIKAFFHDYTDDESRRNALLNAITTAAHIQHLMSGGSYMENAASMDKFVACMLSQGDEAILQSVATEQASLVPEKKMAEIKENSKAMHAYLSIFNYIVRRKHKPVGLSNEATALYKNIYTVPNLLHDGSLIRLISWRTLPGREVVIERKLKVLNDAPLNARREVAERFPVDLLHFISTMN